MLFIDLHRVLLLYSACYELGLGVVAWDVVAYGDAVWSWEVHARVACNDPYLVGRVHEDSVGELIVLQTYYILIYFNAVW